MTTVLVTGSSGFIGARLVRSLAADVNVIAMSRQPHAGAPWRTVVGAFHDVEDLAKLDLQVDVAVHLAAETGGCTEDLGLSVNVLGTQRFLRRLLDLGCRRFVLASSIAAVGCLDPGFVPVYLPMREDHPCLATDAYGASKWLMERTVEYLSRTVPDAEFISFRIGVVVEHYGASMVEPSAALDSPFVQLACIGVQDVVTAFATAVKATTRPGARVYNLVAPCSNSIAPVVDHLEQALAQRNATVDLEWYRKPGREHGPLYDTASLADDLEVVAMGASGASKT